MAADQAERTSVVLLMGPPGAGKGTQAGLLAKARGLTKLSTGDMLRDHVRRGTELGRRAKSLMDEGVLVPDDLIIAMVREELMGMDPVRVLLDGFHRTLLVGAAVVACGAVVAWVTVPGSGGRRPTGAPDAPSEAPGASIRRQ